MESKDEKETPELCETEENNDEDVNVVIWRVGVAPSWFETAKAAYLELRKRRDLDEAVSLK
jgi:hypothetical protein